VANLAPVDAYYTKAPDPVTNDEEDTFFFLGRSRNEPYAYQYRRYRATEYGAGWSPWLPVESRINTPLATAAFAFNRLYLFWTELGETESSNIADNKSTTVGAATATVKFIYQKPDDSWTEPQTLVSDIALSYQENYQLESILNSLKSNRSPYTAIKTLSTLYRCREGYEPGYRVFRLVRDGRGHLNTLPDLPVRQVTFCLERSWYSVRQW
jgi:hypothetical protein